MSKNNKPVKEFKAVNVKAAVFARQKTSEGGKDYTAYSVSIEKSYKDLSGSWQTSTTFFPEDLPRLELVTRSAFAWIHLAGKAAE